MWCWTRKISDKLTTTLMETPHDLPGGGHTKGMAIIPTTGVNDDPGM